MTLVLSSVLEGVHNNKKVLEMDINNGLETIGTIKIIIDPKYSEALKGLETLVKRHLSK